MCEEPIVFQKFSKMIINIFENKMRLRWSRCGKNMPLLRFHHYIRYVSQVRWDEKRTGEEGRRWKKVEFQRVREACNRRTRRNWFVLHGEKRDGERDGFYPVEEGSTETTPPLSSSFSSSPLFLGWREISNVSGCRRRVSRDSAKLTHRLFV